MNLINRFFLRIVLLPMGLYKRMDVNVDHLQSILRVKLMMDDRRPNTFQQTNKRKNKNVTRATLGTMFLSAVMGCFFLFSFLIGADYITHLTVYFSMYIFLLASSLISDFTSVLIDIRDNFIILPKPVTDRTVVTARLLHIIIHVNKIVVPMSLPAVIYILYNKGPLAVIFFSIMLVFASLLTIFIINAVYILILKITTPEKFQGVISYFQIFFAILMYGSYQLIPRLTSEATMREVDLSSNNWLWIAPSYWFALAFQGLSTLNTGVRYFLAVALSIVVPISSIYVVIKYFAPSFNQKLLLVNTSNSEQATNGMKDKKVKSTTSAYVHAVARWFSKKGAERMSFLLCWKMTSRSKDFKLKVYPSIGYMIVMLFIPFLRDNDEFRTLDKSSEMMPFLFIGIIYFSSFLMMLAIQQLTYSDKYKAAWIYFSAPIQSPGELIKGALKAAMIKFYMPVVVLVSAAALIVVGPTLLPNLLLGLVNEVLICSLITYLTIKELPFSVQQSNNLKTGGLIKGLFMLIIPSIVALFHFLIYKITPVVYIFIILSAIATWLVQGSINNISWKKILSKAQEPSDS